jgi:predicted CopG family antitoxin
MSSKTVSLESAAYERLRAAKAPGESFSETVNRILSQSKPSMRTLAGFLSPSDARRVKAALRRMRALETPAEGAQLEAWGRVDDRNLRQRRAH